MSFTFTKRHFFSHHPRHVPIFYAREGLRLLRANGMSSVARTTEAIISRILRVTFGRIHLSIRHMDLRTMYEENDGYFYPRVPNKWNRSEIRM